MLGVVRRGRGEVLETSLARGVSGMALGVDAIILAHTSSFVAVPSRLLRRTILLNGGMPKSKSKLVHEVGLSRGTSFGIFHILLELPRQMLDD